MLPIKNLFLNARFEDNGKLADWLSRIQRTVRLTASLELHMSELGYICLRACVLCKWVSFLDGAELAYGLRLAQAQPCSSKTPVDFGLRACQSCPGE
jgi:hypothetical protein